MGDFHEGEPDLVQVTEDMLEAFKARARDLPEEEDRERDH